MDHENDRGRMARAENKWRARLGLPRGLIERVRRRSTAEYYMTWFAVGASVIWAVLLCLITVVQILYMESLRLRTRDLPALQFFKETLEDRIGVKGDDGVLAFSLIKHTLVVLLGVCFLATRTGDAQRLGRTCLRRRCSPGSPC